MSSPLAAAVANYVDSLATPPADRRGAVRVDLEAAVTLESDHNFFTGFAADISSGGLFIATHQLRPPGTSLRVRFSLPGLAAPIEADVEVRWVRDGRFSTLPAGLGVRFLDLPADVTAAVTRFVELRDSIFYEE